MDPDTIQEIVRLFKNGRARKEIARRLGINVKTVRRILAKQCRRLKSEIMIT